MPALPGMVASPKCDLLARRPLAGQRLPRQRARSGCGQAARGSGGLPALYRARPSTTDGIAAQLVLASLPARRAVNPALGRVDADVDSLARARRRGARSDARPVGF